MFLSAHKLTKYLQPLSTATRDGVDLTVTLEEQGSLGWIGRLIKTLLTRFHSALVKIARTTIQLSQQAPELAKLSKLLEERARAQQGNAEEIAAASQTLAETVEAISQSAREASAFSRQVAEAAASANASDLQSRNQIQAIGASTAALEEQMALLKASSASIGEVVELIKNIADRTRLLSLNAAIEAARAGEQGRGFAVVADEVRKLADQTTSATQNVEALLATIQEQVTTSSETMTAMSVQVHSGIEVSQQAGESIEAASRDINTLIGSVQMIADTSSAQNEKVRAIANQIGAVVESSQLQLEGSRTLAASATQMSEQCDLLLTEVGEFRFAGHRHIREGVESAIRQWGLSRLERSDLESKLASLCQSLPALEICYVTDKSGVQLTADVSTSGRDPGSIGFNCNQRRWFQEATRRGELFVSDIYRSIQTGNYGFTVAAPLFDARGELLGVLGADVRFDHIIDE
ncbi:MULTISPECIES: methyl-accepting chemotaxis protein [unclassified Paludibacterium]|uniref:methyl-accepting chemotaxis protein n=1 Tax=unclassified Paludibacterium TaxID=2618429 RepID=UPI001C054098|nr:methyl-accepting chemotaxis protein [Paludibacterium sp. B53371]BEV73174.1 methyl-accepting chemotaxis protein [Paludibacterium sp. THUN1379]